MKFYTDGSRIGLQKGDVYLGWGAVCDRTMQGIWYNEHKNYKI